MSAMNGTVASLRRTTGFCTALALLVSAALASGASAHKGPPTPTAYVALGDSISFGYKEQTFYENEEANALACAKLEQSACEPADSFEGGFVGDFGAKLAKIEEARHNALSTIDLACPGETSGGLIGDGPLGSAIEAEREAKDEFSLHLSAPCGYHNVDGFPLKTEQGSASELEYAVGLLEDDVDVKAVTINIGSNDELASVAQCLSSEYLKAQHFTSTVECLETEVSTKGHAYPGGLFTHIITNIGVAIGTLRAYGYDGPVVILGFYNPQAELLPGSDELQQALNANLEATVAKGTFGTGVKVASIFAKFNPEKPEGSPHEARTICRFTEECNVYDKKINLERTLGRPVSEEEAAKSGEGDIHPTAKGYEVMAKAVLSAYWAALAEH